MFLKIARGFVLLATISISTGCGNHVFFPGLQARAAMKNLAKLHAVADTEGDRMFQSRIANLQQLGILGEKVAESKADTCYIESEELGFFVTDGWTQYCQLDYVAGFKALISREETYARLQALNTKTPTFALQPTLRDGCRYGPYPDDTVSFVPAGSKPHRSDCRIPDLAGAIGPFGVGRPGNTKLEYTFDPETIDQSVALLWITYSNKYYREELGCAGLFCGKSPRSTPIQAD